MPYLKIDELIIKKVEADEANLLEDYFGISENKFVPVLDNLRNNELDNITDYQHLCSFAELQLIRTIKIQKNTDRYHAKVYEKFSYSCQKECFIYCSKHAEKLFFYTATTIQSVIR